MIRATFLALLSHWRKQPVQFITLVLGLSLATGLWSAVQAINGQARASYAEAAEQLGLNRLSTLSMPSGPVTLDTYVALRRAGWQVSPVLEGRLRLADRFVTLMGVDFLNYPITVTPDAGQTDLTPADIFGKPGRLIASPETLTETPGAILPAPLIASAQVPYGVVLTDIGTAERLLDRHGEISRMLVLPDQAIDLPPIAEVAPSLVLLAPRGENDIARLTDSFHLNLTAFGLLSFAVGLFIVHGTVGLAFEQRRPMIRTLRALGVPLRTLTLLLLTELLLLAFLAGSLGLLLGYLVAAALLPDVVATLRGLYGAPVGGQLTLARSWIAAGIGMALLGALLAGAQALAKLHRMPLLAAPGQTGWARASVAATRRMVPAGLALIAAGIACHLLFGGLIAGFALLAGLMLGAALLLPPTLALCLNLLARRARGPVQEWLWADLRAQLPGLSLALMALLLALATDIGVGTMVSSFRLTFVGWLDQRLASELYITARDDAQGAQLAEWLAPRTRAVLPIRYGETRISGLPARVYGIVDHSTYRDHWPLIASGPAVWDRVSEGAGVLINEQLARSDDIWPGDSVALAPGWSMPISGVYSDYGNPNPQVILSMDLLLARFDGVANRQFGLRIAPEDRAALISEIRDSFDLPASAIVDQSTVKAQSLRIFEKTFVVTGALNLLTLGVASFAILTSLLTLWTLRLPQLAPVWALGLTRRRLARLELLRSVAMAGLTAVLALPLGLALAWVLLEVINVEAFGWRLPMHLFPLDWLWLWGLALLAGACAALIPARRLLSTAPADLLREFSNER